MKRPTSDFPPTYGNQPEPIGSEWLAKFETVKQKAASGGIIALLGARGAGKTRMAYELATNGELANDTKIFQGNREKLPAIYRTAMEMFMELRSTYSRASDLSEFDLFRWYQSAALLVIDEMQERGETSFENQKLTAIVDARYREGRATVLIGNYTAAEFCKSVSPSILSRIQENGAAIECNWQSFRDKSNQPKP